MLSRNILTTHGWINGGNVIGRGGVAAFEGYAVLPERIYIFYRNFLTCTAAEGHRADRMAGAGSVERVARTHARFDTTGLLATTMGASRDEQVKVVEDLGRMTERPLNCGCRRCVGRASGTAVSKPGELGRPIQRSRSRNVPDVVAYRADAPIKVVSIAPELQSHFDVVKWHGGLRHARWRILPLITQRLGGVQLADIALARSTLTMGYALRNLVSRGLTIVAA
jgi:N-acetylglucosamine-6-phosphate deacetylase